MGLIFDILTGRDVNKTLEKEAKKLNNNAQKVEPDVLKVMEKTIYVQQQSIRDQVRIGNAVPEFIKIGIRIFAGLLILAWIMRNIGL